MRPLRLLRLDVSHEGSPRRVMKRECGELLFGFFFGKRDTTSTLATRSASLVELQCLHRTTTEKNYIALRVPVQAYVVRSLPSTDMDTGKGKYDVRSVGPFATPAAPQGAAPLARLERERQVDSVCQERLVHFRLAHACVASSGSAAPARVATTNTSETTCTKKI